MKNFILSLFAIATVPSFAQQKITIEPGADIQYATVDRAGDLYIITEKGDVVKYDSYGKVIGKFPHSSPPTIFDTGNGVRLMTYYRDTQEYYIFNPALVLTKRDTLDPAFSIDTWLACASGDYNLWTLDAADWSLRKIDTKQDAVLTEQLIDTARLLQQTPQFTYMREYQHFLFLLEKNTGIHIFNSLGKYLRTIPIKNLSYFNFLGEELYYVEDNNIVFIDLFTLEERKVSLSNSPAFVLITDTRIFSVFKKKVEIEAYKP